MANNRLMQLLEEVLACPTNHEGIRNARRYTAKRLDNDLLARIREAVR